MTALADTAPATGNVTRYWPTSIIIGELALAGIPVPETAADGPAAEDLPCDPVSLAALERQFLTSMNALARDAGTEPVAGATVKVRAWRAGYDEPAFAVPARYAGWTILAGTATQHPESGCLAFSDPRAGSPLTAVPGLPFGRQAVVIPRPGAHAVVPGWLTSSVIPLEAGQLLIVAEAASAG